MALIQYLIDTNIVIYMMMKRSRAVFEKMKTVNPGSIGVSAITIAELQYGIAKSQNRERSQQRLAAFMLPFEVLSFTEDAAIISGEIRADLTQRGQIIGAYDILIAAQAMASDIPLVTNNTREFERVEGLKLENWAEPI